jgi:hypothetical protein
MSRIQAKLPGMLRLEPMKLLIFPPTLLSFILPGAVAGSLAVGVDQD